MVKDIFKTLSVNIMVRYIEFVYFTSKVSYNGVANGFKKELTENNEERLVALFWHGDSYCLYPALRGSNNLYVVTTIDRRGDYISDMCSYFGYKTIRVPDTSDGGNYIFKIGKIISDKEGSNLAISLDGPLGPYHIPKDFVFAITYLAKRTVMPISISIKRKIELKKRWDNFKIPLPFNNIVINFGDPIEVTKKDKKERFSSVKNRVRSIMTQAD